jgi:MFS family permease
MTMEKTTSKIYYGWYIVGVCFITMAMIGGIGYTFAVFFKPLIEEFHWSRTALAGVVSAGMVVGGLVTPLWGNWIDRAGGRVVIVTAALFAGLSLLLRAYIDTLWQLYFIAIAGSIFFAGIDLIPLSTIISHWFRSRRGTAMGLTLIGGSVGGFLMPPTADWLIARFGWRSSYLILAVVLWVGIIPVAAIFLRKDPIETGLLVNDVAPQPEINETEKIKEESETVKTVDLMPEEEFTLQQALRTSAFWMIAIAFFLPMMSGVGMLTHLVVILTDAGISSQTATAGLGLIAALSMVGRFAFGYAADRFSVRKVFTACYVIEATAVGTLLAMPLIGRNALFAYILVYGLTGGGGLVLAPLIIGECFGLKSLGTIFGMLAISAVIGGAIGPLLAGYIFDSTGSYYPAFIIFATAEAAAAFAISRAKTVRAASVPQKLAPKPA